MERFLRDGFALRQQLAHHLALTPEELERRLSRSTAELAAWHVESADYIAETLRLQARFARGQVRDFGGGIGSHALAAAGLESVKRVWFVDLNRHNRRFVEERAQRLGLAGKLHCARDLADQVLPGRFDTVVCLDVLKHLSDPAAQLEDFAARMKSEAVALFNWYFFKGHHGEYPFHTDDPVLVERFFRTLQSCSLEVFHPQLITIGAYRLARRPESRRPCRSAAVQTAATLMRLRLRRLRLIESKFTTPSTRANRVSSEPRPTLVPGSTAVPRWRIRIEPAVTVSPP